MVRHGPTEYGCGGAENKRGPAAAQAARQRPDPGANRKHTHGTIIKKIYAWILFNNLRGAT
jgi:hypothetical protein